jgi:hypothetical protein
VSCVLETSAPTDVLQKCAWLNFVAEYVRANAPAGGCTHVRALMCGAPTPR